MYLHKNQKHLKEKKENISKELEKVNSRKRVDLIETKIKRQYTVRVKLKDEKEVFIHSRYNPTKEAERFVDKITVDEFQNFLLIGFGLGYHVQTLLKELAPSQKLYVVVVNMDIFKLALEIRDMNFLQDERLSLIVGSNQKKLIHKLKALLNLLSGQKNKLVIHYSSLNTIPGRLKDVKYIIEKIDIEKRSFKRSGDKLTSNIEDNMTEIIKGTPVHFFRDIFRDIPVFVVAAGPSLDKNIDELKNIGDKGIVIAVGTIVRKLINHDIIPDFIVIIDPMEPIYDQLEGNFELDVPLIFIPGANARAVLTYNGPKIIAFPDKDPFYAKLNNILNKGFIRSGGSVATTALDFARLLGGNPLVFVGQDLALSIDGRTHAGDTLREKNRYNLQALKQVEGIDGSRVGTVKNLYMYLRWFESYIKDYPEINFIDATEGGAKISGTEIKPLNRVIESYCKSEIDKGKIYQVLKQTRISYGTDINDKIKNLMNEFSTPQE